MKGMSLHADTTERQRLRDEFAMAALTGLLSHDYDNMPNLAHEAYLIADAMLEARETAT